MKHYSKNKYKNKSKKESKKQNKSSQKQKRPNFKEKPYFHIDPPKLKKID